MTGHNAKNVSGRRVNGYLHGLLADGASPFLFRKRVGSLLGAEDGWPGLLKSSSYHGMVGRPSIGVSHAAPPGTAPWGKRLSPPPAEYDMALEEKEAAKFLFTTEEAHVYRDREGKERKSEHEGIDEGKGRNRLIEVRGQMSDRCESGHFNHAGGGDETVAGFADACGSIGEASSAGRMDSRGSDGPRTARFSAARQGAKADTIIVPGVSERKGALQRVAAVMHGHRQPPEAAHALDDGVVERTPVALAEEGESASRMKRGNGHADLSLSMALQIDPGIGQEEPAARSFGVNGENGWLREAQERIASICGAGFHAGWPEKRRSLYVAKMQGGRREIAAAVDEESFVEGSGLPRGNDGNMEGAFRTLEDHLRQRIEQLREVTARRPDSTLADAAPEATRDAGEIARALQLPKERIVIVGRAPRRAAAPAAFWERSYLSRLFLRPLR